LEEKIQATFKKHVREEDDRKLKLDQFSRMHLYSELEDTGDIKTIYIFMAIGFLIILTACINFMNLATARSVKRAKEIGLRKVVGAVRGQLIKQFIGESAIFSALSLLLALILASLLLPILNNLTGQFVQFEDLGRAEIVFSLIGIVILVGLLSGSYPALFLSAFQPVNVLKGTLKSGTKGGLFRKILVVAQFGISIILIVCTIILSKQLHYVHNRPLGFKKDQIVVIRNNDRQRNVSPLKEEFLRNPKISGVTASLQLPSSIGMRIPSQSKNFRSDSFSPVAQLHRYVQQRDLGGSNRRRTDRDHSQQSRLRLSGRLRDRAYCRPKLFKRISL
jgi:hypothetical protein